MGFWLGRVAVAGLFVQNFRRKDQHDNKIKSKHLSPPRRRQKRSSSTQDSFHSFIDTKIGYHFSDYKKRINLLIPRFLLSFSLCHTILADLITCTPRDKIHVVNHAGEPLHYYSRIRSFKIPTIPSPITTSLLNKTSLNIIFTQFCILISYQNKIYSLNTTTNFYVASAKLRPLQCGTNIFAGV